MVSMKPKTVSIRLTHEANDWLREHVRELRSNRSRALSDLCMFYSRLEDYIRERFAEGFSPVGSPSLLLFPSGWDEDEHGGLRLPDDAFPCDAQCFIFDKEHPQGPNGEWTCANIDNRAGVVLQELVSEILKGPFMAFRSLEESDEIELPSEDGLDESEVSE